MAKPALESGAGFGEKDWINGRTLGLIIFAGVMMIAMSFADASFLTERTLSTQSRLVAIYVLIAMSQAVCLAVGDMNLAVGAIGSFVTVLMGLLLAKDHAGLPLYVGLPIVFAIGPLAGLLNGLIITRLRVDSFIVTLSMMFIYMGLRSGISWGGAYKLPGGFWMLLSDQGLLGDFLPNMVFVALFLLLFMSYLYKHTVLGRRLLATGSNAEAARLSGINTDRMVIVAHVISGFFSVAAAVLTAAKDLGSAAASNGDDWLLTSFAVAIIGGTGLKGSLISPLGILMGAIIFKLIQHSLPLLWIPSGWSQVPLGALILLAVMVDRLREHLELKSRAAK